MPTDCAVTKTWPLMIWAEN